MTQTGLTQSNGEARRSISKDRSVKINMETCEDTERTLNLEDLFHDRYLYLQRGKKNKYIIEVT